jgi:structure-specific recognition protein 1
MRFHVPNNELDIYYAEKNKNKEETKGEESSEDEEMTAAKLFDLKINQKANLSQSAGLVVASIQDLPMLIPRGNYSLDFYSNFCKLHGKTHDYKVMFKDINRIFMLQKPDG